MTDQTFRRDATMPDAPGAAATLMEPLLAEAAGAGAEPVSLTLDYGPAGRVGEAVVIEAEVERATRTLAFVVGRLLTPEGTVLVTASAVFRRTVQAGLAA